MGDAVGEIRRFNRFYTRVIGLLDEGLLETRYSLTEARVIFELAQRDSMGIGDLRDVVSVDGGYLSRVIGRLTAEGLIRRTRPHDDGRRQLLDLTAKGRRIFATLDQRSARQVSALLDPLTSAERSRLVGAMSVIRDVLERRKNDHKFLLREPVSGDYGWVIQRHGALYKQEYGWNEEFEALVARIVADYIDMHDPKREAAWIAEIDGLPVGCVFCVKKDDKVAQLRLMLVEPQARGFGIGSALCNECIRFATRAGYEKMMLWTNDVLLDARRIYERAGFRLVEEEKHHSFGHDLVGQNWWLDL